MLNTRCPHCGTTFRVKPEQLRARNGRVRCGHCQAPFNALESLLEGSTAEADTATATPPETTPPEVATPATAPAPAAPAVAEKPKPSFSEPAFEIPDELPPTPVRAAMQFGWRAPAPPPRYLVHGPADLAPPLPELEPGHKALTAGASVDFDLDADLSGPIPVEAESLTRSDWDWQPESHRQEPSDIHPVSSDFGAGEWEQATEVMPMTTVSLEDEEDEPAPAFLSGYSTPNLKATADAVGETPIEDEPADTVFEAPEHITAQAIEDIESFTPALLQDSRREALIGSAAVEDLQLAEPEAEAESDQHFSWDRDPDEEPRPRAWPWLLAIFVLLLLAGGQTLLWLRHDIARDFPATRPYFEQACASLGCAMPWPRDTAQISIEASDLHPRPGHEGSFELAGTLRNRANFAQAYPYLEITLTDVFNRALVRKVLPPEDWLPAALQQSTAFAPGIDIAFTIYFDALDQPASGYKLYAFYP